MAKDTAHAAHSGSGPWAAARRVSGSRRGAGSATSDQGSTAGGATGKRAAAEQTGTTRTASAVRPGTTRTAETKAPAKKAPAKNAPAKNAPAKKAPAKKAPARKTPARKTPARKAPARKGPAKNAPTRKAPAKKTPTKKTPATKPAKKTSSRRGTLTLAVLPGERPWTKAEVDEVRAELDAERSRLLSEITSAEDDMASLLRDGGEGAGNDQADIGSTALERDAEMSLANNTRDMLFQVDRAKARLTDRSYGICESCGNPVGKARLLAFPRATLCMSCKQRQERR